MDDRQARWRGRWLLGAAVWSTAATVIAIPEIWAAADGDSVPWSTISGLIGHLEFVQPWVSLAVVGVVAFLALHALRFPPWKEPAGQLRRLAPHGRLTLTSQPSRALTYGRGVGPALGAYVVGTAAVTAFAGWAAATWWPDPSRRHVGWVIYGLLALFWVLVPSAVAFFGGADTFPTLFATIFHLQRWLEQKGPGGTAAAAAVTWMLVTGLVILVLHVTLYPYPAIVRIINPTDGGTRPCTTTVTVTPPGRSVVLTGDCP